MIKVKPDPQPKPPKPTGRDPAAEAAAQSTRQISRNAIHGGPKDPKKDKRMGVGRGQKG